jgi:hypothetical protein
MGKKNIPEKDDDLFDVIIYDIETKKVVSVTGRNLRETGYYNVDKRLETTLSRINGGYNAVAVPAGSYETGSTYKGL